MTSKIRKGQAPGTLERKEFGVRFRASFADPAFRAEDGAIARLEEIAWQAYSEGRKAPVTRKAGAGYADPDYDLSSIGSRRASASPARTQGVGRSDDDLAGSRRLRLAAQRRHLPGRDLEDLSARAADRERADRVRVDVDFLDLSLLTSEYGRTIHPCKGCVSTAMPLCHWPCSCYPNHSLGQTNDWMNEIYERWVAAHAHRHRHADALVPDAERAQADDRPPRLRRRRQSRSRPRRMARSRRRRRRSSLTGWDYPKHLDGRVYGVVVHGDVAGIEGSRRALSRLARLDGARRRRRSSAGSTAIIGYYEPYATSHDVLDEDVKVQEETRNVARAVAIVTAAMRDGTLERTRAVLPRARPK